MTPLDIMEYILSHWFWIFNQLTFFVVTQLDWFLHIESSEVLS